MKRNAFTLIELLVSIALFGMITIFMFGAIDQLRKQHIFFEKKEVIVSKKNQILSLLRTDIDRVQSIRVFASSSKDFDSVSITGSNRSLYGIDSPFVTWIILKEENTLVRLESSSSINIPITSDKLYTIHSDIIAKRCEIFRLYDSPKQRLLYLKFENQSPLILEVMK